MRSDQEFLGLCRVCERPVRNYVALSQHLRFNTDSEHAKLKEDWHSWRERRKSVYTATLRCRKCGNLFEISDKALRNKKRCVRCEQLRSTLSKREYEKLSFDKPEDPRRAVGRETKAHWDGLSNRYVAWEPGGPLYQAVVETVEAGERVNGVCARLGITYKLFKTVATHAFGAEYATRMYERKRKQGEQTIRKAHAWYNGLSDDEKAAEMKRRFGSGGRLESSFADQLRAAGLSGLVLNVWQSVAIDGVKVPREADIKIAVGDGRKVVVLCDGEAFHGPGTIHGDPADRMEADRKTALAYYDLGYSVLRYSESEIKDGRALEHLQHTMNRLASCQRVYRNWAPVEELSCST